MSLSPVAKQIHDTGSPQTLMDQGSFMQHRFMEPGLSRTWFPLPAIIVISFAFGIPSTDQE
jgi:hypothetical protein